MSSAAVSVTVPLLVRPSAGMVSVVVELSIKSAAVAGSTGVAATVSSIAPLDTLDVVGRLAVTVALFPVPLSLILIGDRASVSPSAARRRP